MPIYEYVCNSCGHELEILQGMNEKPVKDCPACSRSALHRKISAAAFHLKGTGWYATDFKDKDKAASAKKEKNDEKPDSTDKKKETSDSDSDKKKGKTESTAKKEP